MLRFFRSKAAARTPDHSNGPSHNVEERPAEPSWYWTQHPLVRDRINAFASGDQQVDIYGRLGNFLQEERIGTPLPLCATVGCGDGGLERDLLGRGLVTSITGYTASATQVEEARRLASEQGLAAGYQLSDPCFRALPDRQFDAVFSHGLVGHSANLEVIFANVSRALKPSGLFHLNEYVGPSRFQWSDEQILHVNGFLEALPASLRRTPHGPKPLLARPPLAEMVANSPFLAARSSELRDRLAEYFDVLEDRPLGGGLLHMALGEIAQNFDPADTEATARLRQLFDLEDELTRAGLLGSDFAVLIARPHLQDVPVSGGRTSRTPPLGMAPTRRLWPHKSPRQVPAGRDHGLRPGSGRSRVHRVSVWRAWAVFCS